MEMTVIQVFDEVKEIGVYRDGFALKLSPEQPKFKVVIDGIKDMLADSRQMPAFGVSLDNETRKAVSEGVWVEFDFKEKLSYCGMPFERLLVQVISNYSGFNIIRFNSENGYAGRCYYFDLNKDMSDFYNIIISL